MPSIRTLIAELEKPEYAGLSDEQLLVALNEEVPIPPPPPTPTHHTKGEAIGFGRVSLGDIEKARNLPAVEAEEARKYEEVKAAEAAEVEAKP